VLPSTTLRRLRDYIHREFSPGQVKRAKRALAALLPSLVLAVVAYLSVDNPAFAEFVRAQFGSIFTQFSQAFGMAGAKDIFDGFMEFVLGPALPFAVLFAAWLLLFGLLGRDISGRDTIDRIWPSYPSFLRKEVAQGVGDLIGLQQTDDRMVGRVDELTQLLRFAKGDPDAVWTTISGPEAIGKTRLGLEWLRTLRNEGWDTGLLEKNAFGTGPAKWFVRKRTAILVDMTSSWEQARLHEVLTWTAAQRGRAKLVLVDQVVILDNHGPDRTAYYNRMQPGLQLAPLTDAELKTINPLASEEVIEQAKGRPLYARLGPEVREEALRRADSRLRAASSDEGRRLLAVAAAIGPLDQAQRATVPSTAVTLEQMRTLFEGESVSNLRLTVPGIQPDLLADAILLGWASNSDDASVCTLLTAAIEIAPAAVDRRLRRLWNADDFPNSSQQGLVAMQSTFDAESGEYLKGRLQEADSICLAIRDKWLEEGSTVDELESLLTKLDQVTYGRPFDVNFVGVRAYALWTYATAAWQQKRIDRLAHWFGRFLPEDVLYIVRTRREDHKSTEFDRLAALFAAVRLVEGRDNTTAFNNIAQAIRSSHFAALRGGMADILESYATALFGIVQKYPDAPILQEPYVDLLVNEARNVELLGDSRKAWLLSSLLTAGEGNYGGAVDLKIMEGLQLMVWKASATMSAEGASNAVSTARAIRGRNDTDRHTRQYIWTLISAARVNSIQTTDSSHSEQLLTEALAAESASWAGADGSVPIYAAQVRIQIAARQKRYSDVRDMIISLCENSSSFTYERQYADAADAVDIAAHWFGTTGFDSSDDVATLLTRLHTWLEGNANSSGIRKSCLKAFGHLCLHAGTKVAPEAATKFVEMALQLPVTTSEALSLDIAGMLKSVVHAGALGKHDRLLQVCLDGFEMLSVLERGNLPVQRVFAATCRCAVYHLKDRDLILDIQSTLWREGLRRVASDYLWDEEIQSDAGFHNETYVAQEMRRPH